MFRNLSSPLSNKELIAFLRHSDQCLYPSPQNAVCFTNLSCLVLKIFRFFKKHVQNLNTPQNNSASWDLWEHPTSLLAASSNTYIGQMAALFRAPLNTNTSNCQPFSGSQPNSYVMPSAALFRAPTKHLRKAIGCPFQGPALHRPVCSDQSQTTHQPSKPYKRRLPGLAKPVPVLSCSYRRVQLDYAK